MNISLKLIKFLTFICLVAYTIPICSQEIGLKFKRLSTNEGLSQGHVSAITKDHRGFMWFGTDEGLNRYDGYRFKIYKHEPGNDRSIHDNVIVDLLEDNTGNLWIGTSRGLEKYDREKDAFVYYGIGNTEMYITDIFQDSKNRIWLGTLNGLFLFDAVKNTFKAYQHDDKDINSISHNFISRITEDDNGQLWIGTRNGLNRFSPGEQRFYSYKHDSTNKKSISADRIKTVYKDSKGRIWIGTQGQGISLYNREDNSFIHFRHDPLNPNTLSYNDILSFTEDKNGALWIGTENGGISVFDLERNHFINYLYDPSNNTTLSNNSIHSLYKDDIGNIWAGTWAGGVNFLPSFGSKFSYFSSIVNEKNSLSNNMVLSITGDSYGDIWLGTDGGGLNRFNPARNSFTRFRNSGSDKNSISTDYVVTAMEIGKGILALGCHRYGFDIYDIKTGKFSKLPKDKNGTDIEKVSISVIFKDRAGNLWLGTHDHGGLYFYDSKNKLFTVYKQSSDPASIKGSSISALLEDQEGNIWVGTDDGLELFDKTGHGFIHYQHDPVNKYSINNNFIHSIFQDHLGNLWLGTSGGLNYYNKKSNKFFAYTDKDGIANNVVYGILVDSKNNLWFSSNKGISRFDPVTKSCRNFEVSDGLQDNSFKPNACYKTPSGDMYFGGINGFNVFNPDSIRDNSFIPPVVITDFRIFNKSIEAGAIHTPLQQQITETKSITLSYNQSVLTFEFSALNYTLPEKNMYAYKLAGFDKDWTYSGNQRTATYTNLDPGKYTLLVKAANNDGIWNKIPTALIVEIKPPFWLTWWFKIGALLSILAGSLGIFKWRVKSVENQKIVLQLLVLERTEQLARSTEEERKARLEAENANKSKSIFLATMSHEIRTPMNGVIGMAGLLQETEQTSEQQNYTETIISCGEGLLNVINDILDFSKIESETLEIENIEFDLRICIEEVLDVFSTKAANIGLDLIYQIEPDVPLQITGDPLRLRQVLMNLVSNAIKFTQFGEILLAVHPCESQLENNKLELCFSVRDSGIGIPADKIQRLFKPFSQVDTSTTRKYGGTGLGLVISEKLIKLMGGNIDVVSEPGKGTTFSFTIITTAGSKPAHSFADSSIVEIENKRILVVDDNLTNLQILIKQLQRWKLVPVTAQTGDQALDILSNSSPFDLIITDMNMPVMNGVELAKHIVQRYPALPVILLSSIGAERENQYAALFKSILTKPIKESVLFNAILAQLKRSVTQVVLPPKIEKKLSIEFSKLYPLKILVADDNVINQQLAIKVLSKLGYSADTVENGAEAVEAFENNRYDIILMDVQMPEIDGLEATRIIRQLQSCRQPVIIAMTANAMKSDEAACLEAGMNDYLSKPIKIDHLIIKLEKWALQYHNVLS